MKFFVWNNARLVINISHIQSIIPGASDDSNFVLNMRDNLQMLLHKEEFIKLMDFISDSQLRQPTNTE